MKGFKLCIVFGIALIGYVSARPQHQQQQAVDPAYLRDYYSQIAQAAGAKAGGEATPIFESANNYETQQQYTQPAHTQQRQPQQAAYQAPVARQYQAPEQQQYVQPQQVQYSRPKANLATPRRQPAQQQYQNQGLKKYEQEEEEEQFDDPNASYQFGFDVNDDEFTNYQNRKESRDNGVIKGSYSVVDSDGFIRTVTYTADPKEGFKAEVVREPTDIVVKVPTPAPEHQVRHQPAANHRYNSAGAQPARAAPKAQQQQYQQDDYQQQQQYHQYQ